MHYQHYLLWGLLVKLSFLPAIANAQLIPDNTLGNENSIVNSVNSLQKQIDGGAIRGSNLFHSFKEFNIGGGKSVYFSNPSAIQNILTRVTGNNASAIFGKLGVLGNANLFLINPNGIIFGENASLDISGSFTATTLPSIWFDNGLEFSATNPQAVPLLTVNLTPGLQLGGNQQGDISNQGNLTVGEDLNLVSKNLNLTGKLEAGRSMKLEARDNLEIRDSVNKPFIADAGNDLLLQGNQVVDIFALNNSDSGLFSGKDLILRSATPVIGDARYFSGGSFRIEQLDGNLGSLESPNDPIIRASGDVSFDSYQGASLHILAGGSVNISGDVTITGADGGSGLQQTVILSNGDSLDIDGKTEATLDIRAGTTGFGTTGVTGSGVGNPNTRGSATSSDIFIGGNIRVDAADGLVFLSNQYQPNNNLSGGDIQITGNIDTSSTNGNGGRIFIDSKGDISTNYLYSFSPVNGGTITLDAGGNISISNLNSSSGGNGGAIKLHAIGDISSSNLDSSARNGGAITLHAMGDISTNYLRSFSFGGNGGAITLYAIGDISTDFLQSSSVVEGNGGVITLNAGGNISTSNLDSSSGGNGEGNGGVITLNAGVNISTSNLDSSSVFEGNGGVITLNAGGNISTSNLDSSGRNGGGNGGAITLNAGVNISTSNLDSSSVFEGNGGAITLNAGINISSNYLTSSGREKGGTITLDAGGDISTSNLNSGSFAENGGAITLNAGDDISTLDLDSSSFSGNGGAIKLNAGGDISTSNLSPISYNGDVGIIKLNAGGNIYTDYLNSISYYTAHVGEITLDAGGDIFTSYLYSRGGAITLNAKGDISTSELVTATGRIIVNGGAITINADGDISTGYLNSSSIQNGGAITLDAGGNITTGYLDSSSFFGEYSGNGGAITFSAGGSINTQSLDSSSSLSSFFGEDIGNEGGNSGNGGAVKLESNNGITINSIITSSNKNSGDIQLKTQTGLLELTNALISSNATNNGNGGNIKIEAPSINLTETDITSSAPGEGKSGDIFLNSGGNIVLDNSRYLTTVEPGAKGDGGNIEISAKKLELENYSLIDTGTYSTGNAGNVKVNAEEISLNDNSSILSLTTETGNAGNINLDVTGKVALENNSSISTASTSKSKGNSGNISITSNSLFLTAGSQLQALTEGTGNSGNINLNVRDIVDISGFGEDAQFSGVFTSSRGENSGKGGNLTINSASLSINRGGVLNAQTLSKSDGGDITINADTVSLENGGQFLADTNGEGKAGEVNINANRIINIIGVDSEFENSSQVDLSKPNIPTNICNISCPEKIQNQVNDSIETAQALGESDFGINPPDSPNQRVEFSTRIPYVSINGKIDESTDYYSFEVKEGGTSATFDIDINDNTEKVDTKLTLLNSKGEELDFNDNSSAALGGSGSSSNRDSYLRYTFNTPGTYFIQVNKEISTDNNSGFIPQNYSLQVSLESPAIDGSIADVGAASGIFASSKGAGSAGTINIKTPEFNLSNGAQVTVSSEGDGNAGLLSIRANRVNLDNQAQISAQTVRGSDGNIKLQDLLSLQLNQNSQISASTENGFAGDVTINATDLIQLNGGSTIESEARNNGKAGNLTITTKQFTLGDRSKATVSSEGDGSAGLLSIRANRVNLDNQAQINATTYSGIGGGILLDGLTSLSVNNSEISASTINGKAGNLNINATEFIELTGEGGLSVQATEGGIAGSAAIKTNQFRITDNSQITVSSPSGQAGNLTITADNLFLNQGTLTAETGIGEDSEGANITLNIKDLLWMQDKSLISAEAFNTANGGNITINNSQGFLIGLPFEDSDISANATQGNGGNINITTQNIFGLVFRDEKTLYSDITASSEFGVSGRVTVNQLNVNPASGLVELPVNLEDTAKINAGCAAAEENNFIVSGRGGLPQSPDDLFSGKTTVTQLFDLVTTEQAISNISNRNPNININFDNQKNQIIEATGWVKDADGNVIFVAKFPQTNSKHSGISSVSCEDFSAVNQ